jgi:biotin transport system ATP-binding protein
VTHHLDLLAGFERVLVLEDGRLVDDGPPDPVLAAYRDRVG